MASAINTNTSHITIIFASGLDPKFCGKSAKKASGRQIPKNNKLEKRITDFHELGLIE
jgi:hypothetical protein